MRGGSMITEINHAVVIRGTMKELKVFHCFEKCSPKQTPRVVRIENYVFALTSKGNGQHCLSLKMSIIDDEHEMDVWIKSIFTDHGRNSYADVTDIFLIQEISDNKEVKKAVLA